MYLAEIKAELQEAADLLDKFMNNEKNIQLIQDAALLIANSFKQGGKCFLVVMVVRIVMQCTLPKNLLVVTVKIVQVTQQSRFQMLAI